MDPNRPTAAEVYALLDPDYPTTNEDPVRHDFPWDDLSPFYPDYGPFGALWLRIRRVFA